MNQETVTSVSRRGVHSAVVLIAFIATTLTMGSLGAWFAPGDWYASLRKPPLTPPNWIFAPVWTTLFALMAVAAWRVWRTGESRTVRQALGWYFAQLALNALWSPVFFGLKNPPLAFAVIVLLGGAIAVTELMFRKIDRTAGILLLPYLLWVVFATYLNLMLWLLN